MDPRFSSVMLVAIFAPFALFGIAAVIVDLSQSRRNRNNGVIASWGDLRLTGSDLIVGNHRSARRIPLAGLTARVTETHTSTTGPQAHVVSVVVESPAGALRRTQPYSYGSITAARMFEIQFNRAATPSAPPVSTAWSTPALQPAA